MPKSIGGPRLSHMSRNMCLPVWCFACQLVRSLRSHFPVCSCALLSARQSATCCCCHHWLNLSTYYPPVSKPAQHVFSAQLSACPYRFPLQRWMIPKNFWAYASTRSPSTPTIDFQSHCLNISDNLFSLVHDRLTSAYLPAQLLQG